ncbi:MAG TPA: hypothetical protein VL084_12615 [Thermoanaerobaculia bacterium]|nr:hypothetical protein [Thermoanaerobaculia bacterium]
MATWKRWILPFADSPRELLTALRLAEGEVLYRDVTYPYGPVAPYLDALILRIFGKTVEALVFWRVLLSFLAAEAIRRLASRLLAPLSGPPRETGSAAIAGLVVAACFFQGQGGTYPFPYSVAALVGTAGIWWAVELALGAGSHGRTLAAGAVVGLAAASKIEYTMAAVGPLLALFLRRPRREALGASALALAIPAAAYLLPFTVLSVEHLAVYGPLIAGRTPIEWKTFYAEVFWGGTAREFVSGSFLGILWPSGVLFGAAGLAGHVTGSIGPSLRKWLTGLFFGLGALAAWRAPGASELHVLMPLGIVAFGIDFVRFLRNGAGRYARSGEVACLAVGLAMLPAVLRQPFFFLVNVYAAFSAPLAMTVAIAFLLRRARQAAIVAAFVAGIAGAQMLSRVEYFRAGPWSAVSFPRGSIVLREWDARLLTALVDAVERTTPRDSYVAGFPEGGLVLFLTGRRSPFRDTQFLQGVQNGLAEAQMIDALRTKDVRAAFVVEAPTFLAGPLPFGEGYLTSFRAELDRRFLPVARFGPRTPGERWGPRNASAVFFLPTRDAGTIPEQRFPP